jgi:hypothetical protein
MPRLRDTRSGVVVDVDDETAAGLSAAYEPVSDKAPAKKSASSKSEK